jgi:hypothetical protein
MKKWLRPRLTYANVIATLALFLALGGGAAYAATKLQKSSVGTRQLKKNAVTGAKVKDGSLSVEDFKSGQLPKGERGPVGERGPQGASGATSVVVRYGEEGKPKQGERGQSNAKCFPGEVVTGGGFELLDELETAESAEYDLEANGPSSGEAEVEGEVVYPPPSDGSAATGWHVTIVNGEPSATVFFRAYAMCARP